MTESSEHRRTKWGHAPTSRAHAALLWISEISKLLTRAEKFDATLSGVVRHLTSLPDINEGVIALLDDRGQIRALTRSGWMDCSVEGDIERLVQRVVRQILASGMPLVLRDTPERLTAPLPNTSANLRSLVAVPVKGEWGTIGAILVERERLGNHSLSESLSEDICFLNVIASLLAQKIALRILGSEGRSGHFPRLAPLPDDSAESATASPGNGNDTARLRLVSRSKQPSAAERQHLIDVMNRAGWVQAKAARLLGVTPRQVRYALLKHQIDIKRF